MSEPFIAEIIMFGGNFAPRGWALCQGQILSIAQNTALFSILGTTYGGNGQTTFGLPDMRSSVPIHPGQGPGLSAYSLGQKAGVETVTLLTSQIPAHNHLVNVSGEDATSAKPTNNVPAAGGAYSPPAAIDGIMATNTIGNTGGSQPHTNIQPYLCVNFIIALEGIFPSRN